MGRFFKKIASIAAVILGFYWPGYAVESVPQFDAVPSLISIRSGAWDAPSTWDGNRVPANFDVVRVSAGSVVTIENTSAQARVVGIEGTLRFLNTANTQLLVGTILVHGIGNMGPSNQTGTLEIGTESSPIQADKRAELIFADGPFEPGDTDQHSRGLVAFGKVRIYGSRKDPTFIRLSAEANAGHTTLRLSQSASGWRIGDRIFLPDSKMQAERNINDLSQPDLIRPEEFNVATISGDGLTIGLDHAVAYSEHTGARDANDVLDLNLMPHVANMTRNVVIKSENPAGTRGHLFFHHRADVDMRYAQVLNLGRTRWNDPLNPVTNHIGRYPVHLHHLVGPAGLPSNIHQYYVVGNAILDDAAQNLHKWPITIHNSHYGYVADNVVIRGGGWGIGFETGEENFNWVVRNFVALTVGHGAREDATPSGGDGSGYWIFPNNYVNENVAVHSTKFHYTLWGTANLRLPAFKGADPATNSSSAANPFPILEFNRNEAYGSASGGMTVWFLGANYTDGYNIGESVVRNFKLWHVGGFGVWLYPAKNLTFDGMIARSDKGMLTRPFPGFMNVFNLQDYYNENIIIRNSDFQNAQIAAFSPVFPGKDKPDMSPRVFTVENTYFRCYNNFNIHSMNPVGVNQDRKSARKTIIRNCRFDRLLQNNVAADRVQDNISFGVRDGNNSAPLLKDIVEVYSYNGDPNDNFAFYGNEQAPDVIVPMSNGDRGGISGAPEPNLTNAQVWAKYKPAADSSNFPELELKPAINPNTPGAAIGGIITPCFTRRTGITGFACPMGDNVPSIIEQPATQTVDEGQTATFRVSAVGSPTPGYQWQKNGVDIPGATGTSFVTAPAVQGDNGTVYRCVVSNSAGNTPSNNATLVVRPPSPPDFTQQPFDQGITEGQTATFRVTVIGTQPMSYRWQKNRTDIAGADGANYTTPAVSMGDSGSKFRCIVTNTIGSATSNEATLTVIPSGLLNITQQPSDRSVRVGETATFEVEATGTPAPNFQWQVNGLNISGATQNRFTTPPTTFSDDGKRYRALVSNTAGTLTSRDALLTITDVPQPARVSNHPKNARVKIGQTATFSVTATGNEPLVYQWRKNGTNITFANERTYTTAPATSADNGSEFRVTVTNQHGSDTSAPALLTLENGFGENSLNNEGRGKFAFQPRKGQSGRVCVADTTSDTNLLLLILDRSGRQVRKINSNADQDGCAYWDGKNGDDEIVGSGAYPYKLKASSGAQRKGMIVVY